jgi:hypothetical protein
MLRDPKSSSLVQVVEIPDAEPESSKLELNLNLKPEALRRLVEPLNARRGPGQRAGPGAGRRRRAGPGR